MSKRDNSIRDEKVAARQRIAARLPAGASVLEVFAGHGELYDAVWHRFSGAALDHDELKVRAAARSRPRWAVYQSEAARALRQGFMRHVPFDVLDIDAYGSPWSFFAAWCEGDRLRATSTFVIATDGYLGRVGISPAEKLLFPEVATVGSMRLGLTAAAYLDRVHDKVTMWTGRFGGRVDRVLTRRVRKMAMHYFVVTCDAPTSAS